VGDDPNGFIVAVSTVTIIITGVDATTKFASGNSVHIIADSATVDRTIVSVPVYADGNTTFDIDTKIDDTSVSGTIITTADPTGGPYLYGIALANDIKTKLNAHYIAFNYKNVHTINDGVNTVTSPDATDGPSLVTLTTELQAKYSKHINQGVAYLIGDGNYLHIIDITIPSSPVLLNTFHSSHSLNNNGKIAVSNTGYVYASFYSNLTIINASVPTAPVDVAQIVPIPNTLVGTIDSINDLIIHYFGWPETPYLTILGNNLVYEFDMSTPSTPVYVPLAPNANGEGVVIQNKSTPTVSMLVLGGEVPCCCSCCCCCCSCPAPASTSRFDYIAEWIFSEGFTL
jgi:hypothetical protein